MKKMHCQWEYSHYKLDNRMKTWRFHVLWCGRNRNGSCISCYNKKDLCFKTINLYYKEIENFGIILLQKSKLSTIGVFYRPPNKANYLDLMVEKLSNLNLKDNEIYLLADFKSIFYKTTIIF